MNRTDKTAMQAATMACWWPSRAFPRQRPDWTGIRGELVALMDGAYTRGEMTGDMSEFTELARLYDLAGNV